MKLNVFVYINGKKTGLDELSNHTIHNKAVSQIMSNVELRVAKEHSKVRKAAGA